jgi:UDP-GlcNAc:undecaprenyl-phosphate GlcNAc-1-phosphate transferase
MPSYAAMGYSDAVFAFLVAMGVAALLAPLAARFARRFGIVSGSRDRDLGAPRTPQLGGLAILAGVVAAAILSMPDTIELADTPGVPSGAAGSAHTWAIVAGACVITLVGAIDDARDLSPAWKLVGQITAAAIAVRGGVVVNAVTIPFVGGLQFPHAGWFLSLVWIVGLMNVVNFTDGVDGLAAGICAIDAVAFAIIAFDLQVDPAGVLAALTAGAAVGFLFHNRYPASSYMGDAGANLLGYLLGVVAVVGSMKTNTLLALIAPLFILAVPFMNMGFVVTKRMKYGNMPWSADADHFHNRMARIGLSERRTVAYLYAWTIMFAGVALALRFVPYSDHHGHYELRWALVMGAILLIAAMTSVYLVYLLEIPKFKIWRVRRFEDGAGRDDRDAAPKERVHDGV